MFSDKKFIYYYPFYNYVINNIVMGVRLCSSGGIFFAYKNDLKLISESIIPCYLFLKKYLFQINKAKINYYQLTYINYNFYKNIKNFINKLIYKFLSIFYLFFLPFITSLKKINLRRTIQYG